MVRSISAQEEGHSESGMGNGEEKKDRTNEEQNREQKQKVRD